MKRIRIRPRALFALVLTAVGASFAYTAPKNLPADPRATAAPPARSAAGVFDVTDYGAGGDDEADDTAGVQAAVDAAGERGGTVLFPPGTYVVTSIGLRPGVRYSGYGATIRRPAAQAKFVRTFNAAKEGYLYSGDEDSAPIVIEGLTFDGNRAAQGEYAAYELEQAHLVFLMADPARPGRLRATLRDCHFKDGVADAISVYTNVDVRVSDCTATDCFRGGLTVTGGHTRVQVNNFTASRRTHASGIDTQVDGPGFGGSYAIDATLNNLLLPDGDFDVAVSGRSRVVASNVVAAAPFYLYGGGTSVVRYSNCVFGVGEFSAFANRIVNPGDTVFSNCRFEVDAAHGRLGPAPAAPAPAAPAPGAAAPGADGPPADGPRKWACAHVYWWVSDQPPPRRQSLTFQDCQFVVGDGVPEGDTTWAVYAEADRTDDEADCLLSVLGGSVGAGFDYGLYLNLGGRAILRDTHVAAATAIRLGSQAGYHFEVLVDGVTLDPDTQTYLELPAVLPQNRLTHRGVTLEASQNVLAAPAGVAGNIYRGSRVVLGDEPPGPTTHGLPGDVYRLAPPPQGTYEWLCTTGGAGAGAVWAATHELSGPGDERPAAAGP